MNKEIELKPCREAFEAWFKESAKSPIDPWHKEFAWCVWQASYTQLQAENERLQKALEYVDSKAYMLQSMGIEPRVQYEVEKIRRTIKAAQPNSEA